MLARCSLRLQGCACPKKMFTSPAKDVPSALSIKIKVSLSWQSHNKEWQWFCQAFFLHSSNSNLLQNLIHLWVHWLDTIRIVSTNPKCPKSTVLFCIGCQVWVPSCWKSVEVQLCAASECFKTFQRFCCRRITTTKLLRILPGLLHFILLQSASFEQVLALILERELWRHTAADSADSAVHSQNLSSSRVKGSEPVSSKISGSSRGATVDSNESKQETKRIRSN